MRPPHPRTVSWGLAVYTLKTPWDDDGKEADDKVTRRTGKSCGCPRRAGAAPGTGSERPLLLRVLSGHSVEDYVGPRSPAPSARPRPPACGPAVPLPRASRRGAGRRTDQRPAPAAPAPLLGGLQGSGPAGQKGPGTVGFVRRGTERGSTGPGPDPTPRDALHPNPQVRSPGLPTPGPPAPGTPLYS